MNSIPRLIFGLLLTASLVYESISAQSNEMSKKQTIAELNDLIEGYNKNPSSRHPQDGIFYTLGEEGIRERQDNKIVCTYSQISKLSRVNTGNSNRDKIYAIYYSCGDKPESIRVVTWFGSDDAQRIMDRILAGIQHLVELSKGPGVPIDMIFISGNPDYVDLAGKEVVQSTFAGNNIHVIPNLESYVIGHKAWTILGDLAYSPTFYYELNRSNLRGTNGRTVEMYRIKKYPELVERYNAIKPSSVGWTLVANLNFKDTNVSRKFVYFKATNNDLGYGKSRSNQNVVSPTSPLRMKYAASTEPEPSRRFTDSDRTDEKELAKLLNNVHSINSLAIENMEIKWPVEAIDKLNEDYLALEKASIKAAPSKKTAPTTKPKPRPRRPGQ